MKCHVSGCDKDAMYKEQAVCQKHYFRKMRTGSYDLQLKQRKEKVRNQAGYLMIKEPGHPLAMVTGYVYEHRKVAFELYGNTLPSCWNCGKEIHWGNAHIDHIDCDVTNNSPENLRPSCNGCNVIRGRGPEINRKGTFALTHDGETKTANEWARDPRIFVSRGAIVHRKRRGWSDYDALFTPSKTHPNDIKGKKAKNSLPGKV